MRHLLIALLLCSCESQKPDHFGAKRGDTEPNPTDQVYYQRCDIGDAVPIQIIRLRSGAAFIVIGTDTHGTPIVYTYNAEGWKRDE